MKQYTGLEVAIIGMSGRFPGANNLKSFWNNLKNGVESISFFTDEELINEGIDPGIVKNPLYVKANSFIENKEYFDSSFFNYRPDEAKLMDPQIRLFHECVWSAIEDAGFNLNQYEGKIGLFVGASTNVNWVICSELMNKKGLVDSFSASQLSNARFIASKISYLLNLRGPSIFLDTACSSSLVAIQQACNSLILGDSNIALAGGVTVSNKSKRGYLYADGMIHSRDGHCCPFDAKSSGTIAGEGAGVVVLKMLKNAIKDGDNIWAIIKGAGINNDGSDKVGYSAPSVNGQFKAIIRAQKWAKLEPKSISFIEAHGTATELGDPIEVEALNRVFGKSEQKYCAIGSVKSNIGHLDSAAGVAGFIKTVLAIKNKQIPPSINFTTPNPKINFHDTPFYVNTELKDWKNDDYPLRAGVSSFGIGGTNVHVVLEEAPETEPTSESRDYQLILLSAKTKTALENNTETIKEYIKNNEEISDIAFTLQKGRAHFSYRKMIVCNSKYVANDFVIPNKFVRNESHLEKNIKNTLVFMFSGQGSQYKYMCKDLYQKEILFRKELRKCFDIVDHKFGINLEPIVFSNENLDASLDINNTEYTQPILFIIEYALAKLLMHWGIVPDIMIGHSIGEYVAACISGVFSLEDALSLVVKRGKLMQKVPKGKMLSISISESKLKPILRDFKDISLAAVNSSEFCVVSGTEESLMLFKSFIEKEKYPNSIIHTSHAFHSYMMDNILDEFEKEVEKVKINSPKIPFISNYTGKRITDDEISKPGYWSNHLRHTVRFAEGIELILKNKNVIFLEVGPGKVLSSLVGSNKQIGDGHKVINTVRHPKEQGNDLFHLLNGIGELWLNGLEINWGNFYQNEKRRKISLPTYSFDKIKYPVNVNAYDLLNKEFQKPLPNLGTNNGNHLEAINSTETDHNEVKKTINENIDTVNNSRNDFSNLKEELFEMYSQFFGREDFDIDDDFFDIGGDSLKAFTMIGRIHKTFNIKLSLTEFLSKSSIRKLIEYIKLEKSSIPKVNYTSIPKAKNQDYYPLSPAQKRLYLLQQFDLTSTAYNMPYIIPLGKEADKSKIEEVFKQLINRHESFRTSVIVVDGEPVQLISKDVEFELEELSIENTEVENTRNKFIRAFDLSKAPFLRVALVYIKREDSLLMIDMHHIISDGTTRKILEKEFLALFSGEKLATLPLQYKDYSQWQNSKDQQDQIKDQEQYWLNKFEGEIPVLNLPSDYVRPLMQSHEGAAVSFVLSKEETDGIRSFTKENDLTLYMSLLSVFSILLSKLSGQDDIVVGTPIAGRNHADLENIVGMFVNTLSVRNKVKAEETIREFISSLKQTVLGAYENQNYQFEDLVEKVSVERDTGRNPIFDVMFNLLNQVEYKGSINEDIDNSHKKGTSKFDLNLTAIEYDNNIFFNLEYSTRLFKEETINRIINYFKDTLNQISKGIDLIIGDIQLISEEEKEEILKLSQGANKITGEHQVIQDLFRDQVENNPLKLALKFENIEFTYEELNKKSNQLARLLRSKGVKPNDIVGLMLDRSVDLIIGVLGIIKSGGAYLPIDLNYPDDRKAYMLENSGATLVLIEEEKQSFELSPSQTVEFVNISSEILNQYDAIDIEIVNKETDLFYVIYTSGSTGNPKGVMLEHRNLINLIHNNANTNLVFDRVLQFTSISFDVSFQEIFSTLLSGGQLFLISEDDRQEINKLFELVEKESIETLFLPTAYAKFIFNREKELSAIPESIKHIITAGEQLVVSAAFGKYLQENEVYLHNHYGPTESHVVTTITFSPKEHISELPAIGKPIQNTSIYILDESKKLQAKGIVGEIYIGGIQVARGYLKNNELTAEKFIDHPFKKGERLYRTGDLARWLPDGNIEFLGRIDHQVKIRGFRIELGEIESTLLKHENIKESIVLALEENNEKYLCAYVICKKELNHEEIRAHMSAQVPDYMLPSYFVELDELPLTSNGKVNRKVLPSPEIKAGEDYVAPSNEIEEKLVEIWSEVLNIDKEDISVNANFFSIGGHSLKATILTGKIYKEIGVEFPLREVFLHSTIKSQASQIETSTKKEFVSIPKAKEQDCYGLSSAQRRLYLLQQMDLSSTAYNMPYVIPIGAEAEKEKIEEAFLQLISRHESFRTSFEIEGEEPVQRIHEQVEIKIEEITITKEEVQEKRQQFIQAFDLRKAPLLRVSKVDIKGEGSLLMIDMHHIISDGVSHAILEQDFQRLYSGEELPPLILQYKDYSQWQKSEEQQLKVKKQENYWINKFEGEIPVLNLPIDMVRPTIQSHEGASVSFVLSKEETQHIKLLAKENDLTLYMSVLSVFSILLSKLGGQEDIIVGLPIAGRNHSDLENIVGMFVNTLAIRNEVNGSNTLKEFLRKLKQSTLEAYENQDYQFEDLVENISVERDISRNPLFDVMFNLLNHADYSGDLSNLGNNQYVHIPSISKFDLSLTAVDYGDQLLFNFAYCTHLFKPESIERFIAYFKQIVNQIAEKTEIKIYAIDILTEEEKHQLLYEFNDTQIDYPKDKCIHQLFEEQVVRTPKGIALVYNNTELTYRELNQRSNQLSHYLISKGLKSGNIVSIMLDRSIEMIVGILSVLKAGGTYCPIDINNPIERKLYILEDSKSRLLLTKNSLLGDLDYEGEIVFADDFTILPNSEEITGVISSSKDLSYLIYTSGTTGKPKGVMIRHDGVVNTITWYAQRYRLSPGERLLQLSNYSFDASVNQIFGTLTGGASLYIIEENELLDLSSLYSYLGTHNITVINSVPAILEELISNRQRLPFLQRIISGGEKLSNQLKDKIINLGYELHNHYGPTEGTIVVLAEECSEKDVSLGKPKQNTQSYILSGSYDQLQPIGVKGELCISGEGISPGYLNNEDLTKEKFISHPFKEGERLYRTGDLARWLPDGNIEFSGRIDHQVKIRGFRIELGEIESTLIKHKNIKESVVLVREENGDKYLCAYLVTEENSNEEEIRTYLSASLPDYMIPSYFVQLEKLPLTGNGKVNRKALPVPEIKAGDDYVAPSNATEEKLVKIWSEILNIDKEEISVNDNFFSIGGHSLKATMLTSKIHKEIGVEFPLREVFLHSTIKSQASQIATSTKNDFVSITKTKEQSNYPVSSAQKRLYLLQQFDLTSTAYNMPYIIPLGKKADKSKIEEVFKQLINRHESFRTSIIVVDQEPVHLISKNVEFEIEEISIEKPELEDTRNKFIKPFDLSKAPFLRAAIVDIKGEAGLLMIDMHHIISDGTSHAILEKEFQALLLGKELAPLPLQYKDYSQWQNSKEQQELIKDQEQYWLNKFEGEIPVLNLPTDYARPVMQSHEGATVNFVLSKEETEAIRLFTKENDLTLYMSLLSVFSILLSKLSGQDDIIVGTPIAGRNHADLENIVGMFINTLSIRNEVKAEETIQEFVSSLKQTVLGAYENQNYQFEDLVNKVSVERDISRNPIFDVMFNLLNQAEHSRDISGIDNENRIHTKGVSKFDLSLSTVDYGEQLFISFNYCTQLFNAETIDRFIEYFKQIVSQIVRKPENKIFEIDILTEEEKHQLLYEFNDTQSDYPKDKNIHQLFEEQVLRIPEGIALVYNNTELTYRELNQRSNQLSHFLVSKGLKSGNIVGIMLDRSIEMIVGILSVLKAGGAYCPIDINNPDERKLYILEDSKSSVLLTRSRLLGDLEYEGEIVYADNFTIIPNSKDNTRLKSTSKDLAYLIYTSGTTGKPKGVMIRQDGVVNTICWYAHRYRLSPGVRLLQLSNYSFDASVNQIFGTLIGGASLYMIEESELLDLSSLYSYLGTHNITVINSVPAILEELISNRKRLPSLQRIISGGEKLSNRLKDKIINLGYELHNHYGPTEGTIVILAEECSEKDVTLGKPKQNTQSYILSGSYDQLQPIGVKGELCISGEGISPGYLNNEVLTKEKFISHPFKEGERLYCTGDFAKWLPDGNIEFLGRIDHQVKIRGFRIELGEIESTLIKHKNIKESVVLAREENNEKYLCAYVICKEELNNEELRAYMSAQVPDYMLPSYFVQLESLPLTANGKVNRKALPSPEIKAGDDYVAPSTEIEEKLVEIWSEVLNINKEDISVNVNFFSIGGHSLKATILTGKIYKEIGVEFPLREVFLHSTIKSQASQIATSTKNDFVSIPKTKEQSNYPVSSAQKRLYLLQQFDLTSTAYNMPYIIPLGKEADKSKIEEVFKQLINRHESFRTSIILVDGEPVQLISKNVAFELEELSIEKPEVENTRNKFIKPFDLSKAPFLRVAIVDIKGEASLLMIDMHHIISDGTSHAILEKEFQILFSGEELALLPLQYKDYSQWQNSKEQQELIKDQEQYWLNKFEGEISVLNLPSDYPRPLVQSHEGAIVNFVLSKEETEGIKIFTKENGLTLYMTLLSVFNILLSKLSGQDDIIVGTPIAGRNHADLENIVGMFINTLSIRNEVKAEETIQEFVSSLKQTVLGAYENQNYQFEDLVDKVSVERDTSRNPIFDVVINLLNQAEYSGDISGFNNMEQVHKIGISKFDLTIIAIDYGDQILLSFEYCTQLFKAETIDRFIVYFKQIVSQLARKPEIKITEIDIITEAEKHQLLYEFNNTDADYPKDKTIHQLFEEQVERTPENNALVFQGKEMTYRDLNSKSNQLARLLRNKGVESETIIGLMIESSFELIIGIMGILKAGGAYLPIDPMLPESRKQFMLNNSHSKILLTVSGIASLNVHETLFLESENIYQGRSENLNHINESSDSCYIIYTSGSTGVPKGVIIEHTSVVNFIYSMYNDFKGGFSTLDSCLSLTRFTFDVSVAEYFLPMSFGAKIIFYNSKEVSDIKLLTQAIVDYGITFTYIPPSLLRSVYSLLIQQVDKVKLNKMLVGVEPIKDEILKDYLKLNRDFNIINAYGPTESTICATRYLYKSQLVKNTIVSIGQGLSNTNIYLIDQYNKLVPLGVSGELCISGVGLSRGYLNNPELSSEKFIDHPFKARECLYKTGDLARRLPDGNIEFVGRIDHQVKIRGFRIELGEIENVLLKHKNIKECVVIAIEENRDKYLCAYLVIKEDFNEEEIRTYLSSSLPDYMIPSYFVELEEIPITSNGKVNRKALASPEIKAGDDYVAPSNETEEKIVEIWSEVLNIEKEDISTIANFFSIGGHSLKAANCINKLMNKFDINIPLLEIFKNPTINQLADFIHINKSKTGIDDDHLVLLKEGDVNGENIFLIHDGSGDVDGYIEFCKQANDGINYWGIRAGSLKKYEPTNITIEQLAIKYIKSIKKVQKQGEYNIAGWSLGGTIAFEMIRQLEQEKEKVRFFGIIDSMPPNVNEEVKIKEFTIDSELDWIRKYFDDEVIAGLNTEIDLKDFWLNVIAYLKNIAGASEILKYEIVKNIGFEIKEYEKVSIEDLVKYMNFARSLSKASYNYSPENVINTRISYFAASESKSIRYKNWNIFAQKDMNIKIVKGSHFSIFTQANVKKLYSRFFDCFIACESKILFEP